MCVASGCLYFSVFFCLLVSLSLSACVCLCLLACLARSLPHGDSSQCLPRGRRLRWRRRAVTQRQHPRRAAVRIASLGLRCWRGAARTKWRERSGRKWQRGGQRCSLWQAPHGKHRPPSKCYDQRSGFQRSSHLSHLTGWRYGRQPCT